MFHYLQPNFYFQSFHLQMWVSKTNTEDIFIAMSQKHCILAETITSQ